MVGVFGEITRQTAGSFLGPCFEGVTGNCLGDGVDKLMGSTLRGHRVQIVVKFRVVDDQP